MSSGLRLAFVSLLCLPSGAFGRPVTLHLAVIDGGLTNSSRVTEVSTELRELSQIGPVRSVQVRVTAGDQRPCETTARKVQDDLARAVAGTDSIESLVVQGPLRIDFDERSTFPPFGDFEFEETSAVLAAWAPLRGRLTKTATVTILDCCAIAGDPTVALARVRRLMNFLGATEGTFFGLTGEPDGSGRRVNMKDETMDENPIYPGLDAWTVFGCDLRLGNNY